MTKMPIWLHLKDVPMELFTREGLSYIVKSTGITGIVTHNGIHNAKGSYSTTIIGTKTITSINNAKADSLNRFAILVEELNVDSNEVNNDVVNVELNVVEGIIADIIDMNI
ncbi:hypothetical protein PTKIN_Ptkin19aG0019900 [Pterospermum kingtungense]